MRPEDLKQHCTTYWSNDEDRMSVLSVDNYHWIVELYKNKKKVYTKLFDKGKQAEAEAFAEDWIINEIELPLGE